ncbi:MAG TPA: FprA family A-type flavoprotein [candidate division WOR-3 bacterium]|uniref:FprA family A-type flavoprotein n=1 Tax=candidate division WOR-3 bacterium TaxID=2052148 RepID=A0A9C9K0V3_UNCW3|nr:FprA family A-type flavoprotein [candidate division WOR-3 bacterium]
MSVRRIKPEISSVGAIDWDRRLFDELIPLPEGTTYNAYLIKGSKKTALIDTVDPTKEQVLLDNLNALEVKNIDYVISNHSEQDHAGAIPRILELYPEAKLVTTAKGKVMCIEHLFIEAERIIEVEDGKTLSLGDRTLEFIIAPWVHWPETMLTYLQEDKILFPCDFFGSHLATSKLYADEEENLYTSAKRYYAEIMMPFRNNIKKHLTKLEKYEIEIIAPSHGPIHKNPDFIINAYKDWISDNVKNEVILPYVSMHGSVEEMTAHLINALIQRNITVKPFNLTRTDIGELAIALVDAATLIIGTPTVLTGPHPSAVYAAYLANALRPKTRFASIIGSYGWGGRMPEVIKGMLGNLKVEILPPVVIKGRPGKEAFTALDGLADSVLEKHKELNLI